VRPPRSPEGRGQPSSAMLPVLFIAAETAPASGGIVDQLKDTLFQVTDRFGVNLPAILAQVASFSVVAFVLWRFAFKPVLATINERQRTIESGLKYAEEMQAKLAAAQQESAAILKKANADAARVVEEARKSAKEFLDKQTQEATAKASDVLAKAQQA